MTVDSNFNDLFSPDKPAKKTPTRKAVEPDLSDVEESVPEETPKVQATPVRESVSMEIEEPEEDPILPPVKSNPSKSLFSFGVTSDSRDFSPVREVAIGTHVKRFPIEKYKGNVGITSRIGILKAEALYVKYHYEKGIGPFYCFAGKCCTNNGFPMGRYILPCVRYNTDMSGNLIRPVESFEITFLQLPEEKYTQIAGSSKAFDLTNIDFEVTCSDAEFQKLGFANVGAAFWRSNPEMEKRVVEKASRLIPMIKDVIAMSLTEEEYKERRGDVAPSQADPSLGTFSDLIPTTRK